ncbi:MAG: putative nucleotide-diphospho-sugar transferase [Opitutae bacterium]
MSDVIFCLALDNKGGVGARTQARLLHASARLNGWDGDFLVLHNKSEDFYAHRESRHARDLQVQLTPEWQGRHQSQNMKMHCDTLFDMTEYDRVMFCDIDTLFLDNPKTLFDCSDADISFAREERKITDHVFNTCFTDEQMKSFPKGTNGVNSGQFITRNRCAPKVWDRWRTVLAERWTRNNKTQDQGPFNAMLFFDGHGLKIEEFPFGYVRFPFTSKKVSAHWDAKFLHYCGWNGANKLRLGLQEFVGMCFIQKKTHEATVLDILKCA